MRLFLLAFVVYNANLRSVSSLDTYPNRFLPISIIREFNLDLDEFPFLHKYPEWMQADPQKAAYYVRKARGHYVSNYPVMPAVLSVPVYVIPVLLGMTDGPPSTTGFSRTEIVATLLSKVSASAAVAFSVAIVYLAVLRRASRAGALTIALVYAFGTSSWSVSSQGLWQTAMSQPLLALALYFLVKARDDPRNAAYAGIPLALSVACRPHTVIFAGVLFAYVLWQHREQVARFLVAPVVVGSLLVSYNLYYFGNVVGGYDALGAGELFTYPRWEGFLGLLVSPSRGLFVYSPVLLFAAAGVVSAVRSRRDPLLLATAVATVLTILFYSSWRNWPGAFSYSYRHLVDLLPGLSLFLAVVWTSIVARRWTTVLFAALVAFSLFTQVVGAFFYPCHWIDTPVSAYVDRQRFWDWTDPEFLRCVRAGPVEPEGLRFLRDVMPRSGGK